MFVWTGACKSVPGLHQIITAEWLWGDCVFTICLRGRLQRNILEGLPHKPLKVFVIAQPRLFCTGKCILMGAAWSREPDLASQQPLRPQCRPGTTQGRPWEHSGIFPSALDIHKHVGCVCVSTQQATLNAQLLCDAHLLGLSTPHSNTSDPTGSRTRVLSSLRPQDLCTRCPSSQEHPHLIFS